MSRARRVRRRKTGGSGPPGYGGNVIGTEDGKAIAAENNSPIGVE